MPVLYVLVSVILVIALYYAICNLFEPMPREAQVQWAFPCTLEQAKTVLAVLDARKISPAALGTLWTVVSRLVWTRLESLGISFDKNRKAFFDAIVAGELIVDDLKMSERVCARLVSSACPERASLNSVIDDILF
jgi:hypothetical protein